MKLVITTARNHNPFFHYCTHADTELVVFVFAEEVVLVGLEPGDEFLLQFI